MNRFRYWRDPLFLGAATGYAVNRWLLKPWIPSAFLHGHFNDLLLIPAALPLVLWLQRRTGLRVHDRMPTGSEIFFHLAVWSVICEFIGPVFLHHGTADWWDVTAYAVGAIIAGFWWHRAESRFSIPQS